MSAARQAMAPRGPALQPAAIALLTIPPLGARSSTNRIRRRRTSPIATLRRRPQPRAPRPHISWRLGVRESGVGNWGLGVGNCPPEPLDQQDLHGAHTVAPPDLLALRPRS